MHCAHCHGVGRLQVLLRTEVVRAEREAMRLKLRGSISCIVEYRWFSRTACTCFSEGVWWPAAGLGTAWHKGPLLIWWLEHFASGHRRSRFQTKDVPVMEHR